MSAHHATFRDSLMGMVVVAATMDSEGIGIELKGGWNLAIWCQVLARRDNRAIASFLATDLIGLHLESFLAHDGIEVLVFSDGLELSINLYARSSEQPEAMMLSGPENLIVVWND